MTRPQNVMITGIGGQGVVTAAALLRQAIVQAGFRLTGLDNRGGAQRLGHVAASIRFAAAGEYPMSPEIPAGSCDVLITTELSEGLRYEALLGPETVVVAGSRLVIPTNQRRAGQPYITREECRQAYLRLSGSLMEIDAEATAERRWGTILPGNLLLLGAGVAALRCPSLLDIIAARLSGEAQEAFREGCSWKGLKT